MENLVCRYLLSVMMIFYARIIKVIKFILNHLPSQKIYNLQPLQAVELFFLFRRLDWMNVYSETEVLYEQTFVGGGAQMVFQLTDSVN